MEKIKHFFKKENYTKVKLVLAVIFSIAIAVLYAATRETFIIDRIFLVGIIIMFVLLHFILKLNKMYNFIFKYRFSIAGIVFLLAVALEYSGSSIGVYNQIFQGESTEKYFTPVLGEARSIRSDEWVVNTPIFTSQAVDPDSKFAYYNDNLRGTKTDMFSIVAPAVADILTLGKPFNIGYLLLGASRGLSVLWAGKWIALLLISFEFFLLITNRKKVISAVGMLLVTFSASTVWWNMTDYYIWGMLAVVLIDKYFRADKLKIRLLCAFGIFISSISYVFIMYPAWQVPFAFIYLAVLIGLFIKNRKIYKFKKSDILIILLVIAGIVAMGLRYLYMSSDALKATMNTDYPGSRFEKGGGGLKVIISYVYSFLPGFKHLNNPCEVAGMISFFPIPIILACIYLLKNKNQKEHMAFLIPMLIVSVVFSAFTLFTTNEIFAKITLLYLTPGRRLAVPLGFTQIILLIYLLAICDQNTKIVKDDIAKVLAILFSVVIFSEAVRHLPADLNFGSLKAYICGLVVVIFIYLIFTINNDRNKKILLAGLALIALVTGATVNPIQKGISVLTDKPVAKEVQNIVQSDKNNNLWITDDTNFYMPNYLLASGAKVINSTNIYPNFDLFKTVLGDRANDENIRKIYNRYAHITMEITQSENNVELMYQDSIRLKLTPEKVKDLGIKYIVSVRNIEKFDTNNIKFDKIYDEQGVYIYKVNY